MKADVYTGFLTDKVKVFGTERRAKPFVLPGKVLRRVTPFLLASAMTLTACSPKQNQEEKENNGQHVDYTEIYHDVVDRYNLTELKAKEPLSQEEINELIIHTDAPELRDRNFNHCPENNANFWEIVKNGINATKAVQNSPALTYNQKKEYQITAYKMLAQISRVKGTKDEVDLSDYNNLKAFLYFEKVLRYGDNYDEVLQKSAGWIDERDELFGRYYKDYQALVCKAAKYPGVKKLAQALYNCNDRFMISYADSAKANALSKKMLQKWLQKQEIKDDSLWYFTSVNEDDFANAVAYWCRRGMSVGLSLGVDSSGNLSEGDFSPVGAVIIHELQHVMQKKPASAELPEDNRKGDDNLSIVFRENGYDDNILSELGPTLCSLTMEDRIYKAVKGIEADKVLDYGTIETGSRRIKMGEVAVWFGEMMEKYPHRSIDRIVAEDEVLSGLNQWGMDGKTKAYRRGDNGR